MRYLILLTLTLLASGCGQQSSSEHSSSNINTRIINGVAAAPGVGTQIVSINTTYKNGDIGLCSGTAISDFAVLTAAHCVIDTSSVAISALGRPVPASEIHIAPGFFDDISVGAIFNDLAVLRTKEPLGVGALGILGSRAPISSETIQIYGYGIDQDGNYGSLLNGAMTLSLVTPNHLFANFDGRGSNTCAGDSGGPALVSVLDQIGNTVGIAIAGVVSSGTREDCQKGDTTLFTNLTDPALVSFVLSVAPEASVL